METTKGNIVSYSVEKFRPGSTRTETDGYHVMYDFVCACGAKHSGNAHNVWPHGDFKTYMVLAVCEKTLDEVVIELVRP